MSLVVELGRFYLSNELVRDAERTLPSDYNVEDAFIETCTNPEAFGLELTRSDYRFFIEKNSVLNELINWNRDTFPFRFYYRPVADLVEVISRDDDGNFVSCIAAKVFDSDSGYFTIPIAFPIDEMRLGILAYLSLEQRIGFLTELVRTFSNLVRIQSGLESMRSDLIRCLGQLVGFLRLAVRDYSESKPAPADKNSSYTGDDSPVHVKSLSKSDSGVNLHGFELAPVRDGIHAAKCLDQLCDGCVALDSCAICKRPEFEHGDGDE